MKVAAREIDGILVSVGDRAFGNEAELRKQRARGLEAIEMACAEVRYEPTCASVAADIGAHIGTWTLPLAERFTQVVAFEPVRENYLLLMANLDRCDNVHLFPMAIGGPLYQRVALKTADPTLSTIGFCDEANGSLSEPWTVCIPLDALGLHHLHLVKIDVEGLELEVLRGAAQTIRRCKPVVIFEDNYLATRYGHQRGDAKAFLEEMGYREVGRVEFIDGMFDVVMAPEYAE